MEYKCPLCGEHITSLDTRQNCIEYGTLNIESEDYELNESENYDGMEYFCPECGEEILGDPNDLEEVVEEKEEEIIKIDVKNNTMSVPIKEPTLTPLVKCPDCGTIIDREYNDKEVECPKCNLIIKI